MRAESSECFGGSIKAPVRLVRKTRNQPGGPPSTDQSDSDQSLFFARAAQGLLGKDAGLALHLATGFEERTCYRYASGERMPPAFMLRVLLRSPNGEQWLNAIMDSCDAPWWRAHQRAVRRSAALDQVE
jgi:hypothetical protein